MKPFFLTHSGQFIVGAILLLLAVMYVVIPILQNIALKRLVLLAAYLFAFAVLWTNFYFRGASSDFLYGAAIFSLAVTSLYLRLAKFCSACGGMYFDGWLRRRKKCVKCGAVLVTRQHWRDDTETKK